MLERLMHPSIAQAANEGKRKSSGERVKVAHYPPV